MPSIKLPWRGASRTTGGSAAKPAKPKGPSRQERRAARRAKIRQLMQAFQLTRANDPKLVPYLAITGFGVLAVFVLIGVLVDSPVFFSLLGVLAAIMALTIVFGRRAQASAYGQVEGQLGAAAAVLQSARGGWRVTPAVAIDPRTQDLVHRVVGRAGVVLVGEGSPRTKALVAGERKRISRVVGDTHVYEVFVGDGEGQVPLRKLQVYLAKLPRNYKPAQVTAFEGRLKALGATRLPIPKGPMPRSPRAVPRGRMR